MISKSAKRKVVLDTIDRFPTLGNRTLARIVMHDYGDLFENNIEKVRTIIRYHRGSMGEVNRKYARKEKVEMPLSWSGERIPYHLKPGTWLIMADLHVPFHSMKAVESALSYAKKQNITGILIAGDWQDCASVSFWSFARKRDFDKEMEIFIDFVDFLCAEFPDTEIVYQQGNHEYRLPRYYQMKAPELIGIPLASIESVLGFEERGIEQLDYLQLVMAGKLPILHGHEVNKIAYTVNPARGLFIKIKSWGMCAHVHRTTEHSERDIHDTLLTTWTVGCLCDLSPDYNPYTNNWNWGFAIVNVEKDGNFEVQNKRMLSSGKVV